MEVVLMFQIAGNFRRTTGFEIVRQFTAFLIDAQRYDMEMLPVNVLMLEDNVGLISVTHFLHVFICDFPELFVGQFIFRRRVQRGMEDRIGRPAVGFEVRPKAIHADVDIHSPVFVERFQHPLPEEHLGFILIHFFLVIAQGSAGRGARPYIRNHSLACLAKLRISILRAFISLVRCSNAAI